MTDAQLDLVLRDALLRAVEAECAPLPGEEERGLSPALRRRLRPLLADPFGRRRARRCKLARRTVAALLALTLGAGALFTFNPDARAWVQRVIVQFWETHTNFRLAGDFDSPTRSLSDWGPTWVPEGYMEIDRFSPYETNLRLVYQNTKGTKINISISTSLGYAPSVDNEHHVKENISVNGYSAHFLRAVVSGYASHLSWFDEDADIACSISAELPVADLVKIAESIKKN